jgi:thiol-disulfide isomerase/thioredoxin
MNLSIRSAALAALVAATSLSCSREQPTSSSTAPSTAPTAAAAPAPASSPASAPASSPAAAGAAGPVFLEDDYAAALAAARAGGKVVFVDAWAPWCHTCLSMQREVLTRPALAAFSDRVVFVAVDTDRPENAAFLTRFPVSLWPTFFVVDPTNEVPLAVHPGSMSLDETVRFVDVALAARDPAKAADPQTRALRAAHAAVAAGEGDKAAGHYIEAATAAGPRRTEAMLGALRALPSPKDCVAFGLSHLRDVDHGGAPGDVAAAVLSCARDLPAGDPDRTKATAVLQTRLLELAATPAAGASVDDRADVLATLAGLHDDAGDQAAARAVHQARLALLEEDAARADSVEGARVHDYARMNSYLALGRGDEAVGMLMQRTQQLPTSYEAWARLAFTLHKLGRQDEAWVAVDKAIALSYGTRRLRYLTLKADIAAARKDVAGERAALQQLGDDGDRLPAALGAAATVQKARARLQALPTPAAR